MAHYVFYFLDGEAVIIEADDGGKDDASIAFNKQFSRGALQAVDFYERFDNAVTKADLKYSFYDGAWHKIICYDTVMHFNPNKAEGTFRNLWSWLAGSFTKGEGYSTVPVVVFDDKGFDDQGPESGKEVSVPYGVDKGSVFEMTNTDNEFDKIWKTLPRKRTDADYVAECSRILGRTTQESATVYFPADPDSPDEVMIQADCDFGNNRVTFFMYQGDC